MEILKSILFSCLLLVYLPLETNSFESLKKCAVPNLTTAFTLSMSVFAGKVLSEAKEGDVRIFEFQVEKYWKGKRSKKLKVNVRETPRFQSWFKVGESYLVFAYGDKENGRLYVGRCSASKPLSEAQNDIKKLGKAKVLSK